MVKRRDTVDPFKTIKWRRLFYKRKEGDLEEFSGICGNHAKKHILVSENGGNQLRVLKLDGKLCFVHTFSEDWKRIFPSVRGVCVYESRVFVCDRRHNKVQILDKDYKNPVNIYLDKQPKSICCLKNGYIVLSTHENYILLIDHHGKAVGKTDNNQSFNSMGGICCNSRDQIIAVDSGNHSIKIFSAQLESISVFGSRGNGPEQLCDPRGICVDEKDNIYVADWGNRRISIFDSYGVPIQQIPCPSTQSRPNAICIMEGRIFVACDSFIQIFAN